MRPNNQNAKFPLPCKASAYLYLFLFVLWSASSLGGPMLPSISVRCEYAGIQQAASGSPPPSVLSCQGSVPSPRPGLPASEQASADFPDWELKTYATGTAALVPDAYGADTYGINFGIARAEIQDVLTFAGTGDVTFSLRTTGSIFGSPAQEDSYFGLSLTELNPSGNGVLYGGEADGLELGLSYDGQDPIIRATSVSIGNYSLESEISSINNVDVIQSITYHVQSNNPVLFRFWAEARAIPDCWATPGCIEGKSVASTTEDFGHTASLSVYLPEGITYTTASGYALPVVSTTPEPGTLDLLGLGIAGISYHRRKQSKT